MTKSPQEPHAWTLRVCYADTDAGGVVHHAGYLRWFEAARTDWLASLGIEQRRLREETNVVLAIVEARLSYRKPAGLDDIVRIDTSIAKIGRTSLEVAQVARLDPAQGNPREDEPGNAALVNAGFTIVAVDTGRRRATALPASLLDRLKDS